MILLLWVRWSAVLNLATCMAVYTNTAYTPNTVYKNTAYTPNVRILPAVYMCTSTCAARDSSAAIDDAIDG